MWQTLSHQARQAIGELCDEHGRHLYDYCRTALAGSDAELAVAEALLSAHAHAGRLAERRLLRPWLYGLTRAHRAAVAASRPASTGSWSRPGIAPDLVPEGLMALDGPHRELLDLSVRHGLTTAEIGMIFDAEPFEVGAIVTEAADTLEEWFAAVRAARTRDGCPRLAARLTDWTKAPGRRHRTRIARHILSCPVCRAAPRTVRADTLLRRLPLATMPATLREQPAWGRPLAGDASTWRSDGFPVQARGLMEPAPALISLVPGPEIRGTSWSVAGAAATDQEPAGGGAAPASPSGVLPSGVAPTGTGSGSVASTGPGPVGGAPASFGAEAMPRGPLSGGSSVSPANGNGRDGAAHGTGSRGDGSARIPLNRNSAGRLGRDPLTPPGTAQALLDATPQADECHVTTVPNLRRDRVIATGPARTLPEVPAPRPETPIPTPARNAPVKEQRSHTPTHGAAGQARERGGRRDAEPGDKLVFAGAPRDRVPAPEPGFLPEPESVRVSDREPVSASGPVRVPDREPVSDPVRVPDRVRAPDREPVSVPAPRIAPGAEDRAADDRWEEFWRERPDEDDPEARISLRWLAKVALVIGVLMLVGGLVWAGVRDRAPARTAPAPPSAQPAPGTPSAQLSPGTPAAQPSSGTPSARSSPGTRSARPSPDTPARRDGTARDDDPVPVPRALPAPPAPVARLSPASARLGTRRTGTFALNCTGDCQVTSFSGSNGIVVSGNSFTVRAPAERPGCPGPAVTESGVITIGWTGTATGDGESTEGTATGDGTLTMIVSWTVTTNRGAFIPDTNGGGFWSNCPKNG